MRGRIPHRTNASTFSGGLGVNPIEIGFSILARKALEHASLSSTRELDTVPS